MVIVIILAEAELLGDVATSVRRFLLQHLSIRYASVADEVVNAPVGEELVHLLAVVRRPCVALHALSLAGINDVVGIDEERIELHLHHQRQSERRPFHTTVAAESAVLAVLLHLVDGELILSDTHHLAYEVLRRLLRRLEVLDVHH